MDGPFRVLAVDDDPDFVALTATFLERETDRLAVDALTSADEALARLSEREVDCIVSDYDMPGRNGIEFLEAVRESHSSLPFILFTGKGSEEIASEAISAGVTDYLQKQSGNDQYTLLANRIENAASARRAASNAQRSRHRLEQMLKTVPACVVQVDRSGSFIFANERAKTVLGLERDDVTDRTYNDPVWRIRDLDGDPIPDAELPFRRVMETGDPLYGYRHTIEWPDGTEKTLLVNGAPLFGEDGAIESVVFSLSDISARKERQQELEVMHRRLEAILENTTTPIFMKDTDGKYIFVNRGYRELFGLREEEIIGYTDNDIHPPEMVEDVRQNDQTVLDSGESIETEEEIAVDGEIRTFMTAKAPIYDTGERADPDTPVAIFGVANDITALKEREAELECERDRLDVFASLVSHDLRNPLHIAGARLELATEECNSAHLADVEDALERMHVLIDDILTLARGNEPIDGVEPVSLPALVEATWHGVHTDGATLVVETDRDVHASEGRLRQLFENLLRNAVEHGGGDVTVTVGDLDGGFYVEDDGGGIPETAREQVFEPGYSTADCGTGFGLVIAEQVVEAHGWQIRVTEGSAGGARFEITDVDIQ